VNLRHPAVCDSRFIWVNILLGVDSLESFEKSLKECCEQFLSTLVIDLELPSGQEKYQSEKNKYIGDAFEVFVEFLLLKSDGSNLHGVTKYQPIDFYGGESDIGVDGKGIHFDNKRPITVQVKFRSIYTTELFAKADGLSGFVAASQNIYGVDINDIHNMVVVTNCVGIDDKSKNKMLFGKVNCLGREQLIAMVNNSTWWDEFRRLSRPKKKTTTRLPLTSLT